MHDERESGDSSSEPNLDSAEYRERLKRKLNCLIAVLEVATAKVKQSLAGPAPDVERLTRIQKNLQDTLDVCVRARTALDKRGVLPANLSHDLAAAVNPTLLGADVAAKSAPSARSSVGQAGASEMNAVEKTKFARLPKIDRTMIGACDFDELSKLLQG
jgi:hypothetical protein